MLLDDIPVIVQVVWPSLRHDPFNEEIDDGDRDSATGQSAHHGSTRKTSTGG